MHDCYQGGRIYDTKKVVSMIPKIEPCPYCGRRFAFIDYVVDSIDDECSSHNGEVVTAYRIKCRFCHAQSAMYDRPEYAIAYWNALSILARSTTFNEFEKLKKMVKGRN